MEPKMSKEKIGFVNESIYFGRNTYNTKEKGK
jgi:hypothetical protein